MITISTEAYISAQNPSVLLPNVPEGAYEVIVVLQPKAPNGKHKMKKPRKAGFITAKITMSDDFNAPLEDFKEYM
ncbi:MAG: DUF2281 domain-containing protein [Saprospiraceae bacterium]